MVGGGPSGLSAALAARRAGAEVILMERWVLFLSTSEKKIVMMHLKDLAVLVAVSPPWAWRPWLGTGA